MLAISNIFDNSSIHRAASTSSHQALIKLTLCVRDECSMNARRAMTFLSKHVKRLDECLMCA